MSFTKITSTILYVLMAISVLFILFLYFGGTVAGTEGPMAEPKITDTILYWAYVLFFIAAVLAVVFPIVYVILHPTNLKGVLIVAGVGLVLFFISRGLASDAILPMPTYDGPDNVPSVLKNVGTALIFTEILLFLAVISIVYSAIASLFK